MMAASSTIKVVQPMRHIDGLRPHPDNPRGEINPDTPEMQQLADDIKQRGIIEPLVITPDGFILAGHRRRVAARIAGVMQVPVTLRELRANEHAVELMLAENMQRESLNLLEEARGFKMVMDHHRLNVMDLARRLSVLPSTVSSRLAILKLEPDVQALYGADRLPVGVAALLARVSDGTRQRHLAGLVARKTLSAPKLKEIVVAEFGEDARSTQITKLEIGIQTSQPERAPGTAKRSSKNHRLLKDSDEPTRAEAVALLSKSYGQTISIHSVGVVLETLCCACGMIEQPDVCRTCPLPRFVKGLIGRASDGR